MIVETKVVGSGETESYDVALPDDARTLRGILAVLVRRELADYEHRRAASRTLQILTPADPALSGSILTFRTPRLSYEQVFSRLLGDHQLRTRPVSEVDLNAIRISTHLFNSPEECDRLVGALDEVLRKA